MIRSAVFVAMLALSACASTADAPPLGPPSLEVAAGEPAPPQARFYADCIAQAAQTNSYDREGTTIRFSCDGDVARVFFDGLGPWSAEVGSEMIVGIRTWRFSVPIRENPSGIDYCWRDAGEGAPSYACVVVLRVGEFLQE